MATPLYVTKLYEGKTLPGLNGIGRVTVVFISRDDHYANCPPNEYLKMDGAAETSPETSVAR